MKVQVLGTGCPKCEKMAETAVKAADSIGLDYQLIKVVDLNDIMSFGVMITPALAVDGKVLVRGRVPSLEEMKELLEAL
ncbi:thioredoxin family protein [Candidatus Fermentibacteria bacterium]|nr:MAG: thioredoxin family protein [Candidatus Fermentibacteria bacterium]